MDNLILIIVATLALILALPFVLAGAIGPAFVGGLLILFCLWTLAEALL